VLVDELAHTNMKAASTPSAMKMCFELLDAGIDVVSTLNVQHIESLAPTIRVSPECRCARRCGLGDRRAGEIGMAD